MTVWALFDSGNGSYTKGAATLKRSGGANIDIYPIGIDIENKNNHFINLNLADYGRLFGDNTLFDTLDKLPKPDLIIASPPCESWSVACAMANGTAFWKREDLSDSLFEPQKLPSPFTVRPKQDYIDAYHDYDFEKLYMKRINGELTVFNTIQIIKRYQPRYWIIENPANSKIWEYIRTIFMFELPYMNLTRYNNYEYPLQKPTKFASNVFLGLKTDVKPAKTTLTNFSKSYNERSNIPQKLVIEIFSKVYKDFIKLYD
ncbi:DNA methyltransferase [Streptococcus suis]|uniref:DNA methyltransferase n=1 Tax=Streptococcus suis TaxID=1307 RepID=UPI001D358D1D|nr:DNA methyltransferase [Streptococcus suis]MBS7976978.1 DNA methyltransferase [Streptococcus suis]HEM6460578.1 DNA methyltransferase [Streptococcus suis]